MVRIAALVGDIFFIAKIGEMAKQCNSPIEFAAEEKAFLEKIRLSKPDFVVVDLNAKDIGILQLPSKIKSISPRTEVTGFLAHVQTDLKQQAEEAGYKVYTRSKFFEELSNILKNLSASSR